MSCKIIFLENNYGWKVRWTGVMLVSASCDVLYMFSYLMRLYYIRTDMSPRDVTLWDVWKMFPNSQKYACMLWDDTTLITKCQTLINSFHTFQNVVFCHLSGICRPNFGPQVNLASESWAIHGCFSPFMQKLMTLHWITLLYFPINKHTPKNRHIPKISSENI